MGRWKDPRSPRGVTRPRLFLLVSSFSPPSSRPALPVVPRLVRRSSPQRPSPLLVCTGGGGGDAHHRGRKPTPCASYLPYHCATDADARRRLESLPSVAPFSLSSPIPSLSLVVLLLLLVGGLLLGWTLSWSCCRVVLLDSFVRVFIDFPPHYSETVFDGYAEFLVFEEVRGAGPMSA